VTQTPDLSFSTVLAVGDTHADRNWLAGVVLPTAAAFEVEAIVIVGDFGWWGEARKFIDMAVRARRTHGIDVLWLDGNHEDHPYLGRSITRYGGDTSRERRAVNLDGGLYYLPRGAHFTLGGLDAVAFGGAASIDRADRVAGRSWFEEELIGDLDISFASKADIMFSHDAPSGWDIPRILDRSAMRREWLAEIAHCEEHRTVLRRAYDLIMPGTIVHGHYHSGYQLTTTESWGDVHVHGLNCNGYPGWGALVSVVKGTLRVDRSSDLVDNTLEWARH
jgi:hypothetical protein